MNELLNKYAEICKAVEEYVLTRLKYETLLLALKSPGDNIIVGDMGDAYIERNGNLKEIPGSPSLVEQLAFIRRHSVSKLRAEVDGKPSELESLCMAYSDNLETYAQIVNDSVAQGIIEDNSCLQWTAAGSRMQQAIVDSIRSLIIDKKIKVIAND